MAEPLSERRARTRYLEARPYAGLTVLGKGFWGEWLTVCGPAERRLVYVLTPERVYPSSR